MSHSIFESLAARVIPSGCDAATEAVLRAALRAAADVTHECGTPEATSRAVLATFRDAMAHAAPAETEWKRHALDLSALVAMYNSVVMGLPQRAQASFGAAGVGVVAAHLLNTEPTVPLADKTQAMERYCSILKAASKAVAS